MFSHVINRAQHSYSCGKGHSGGYGQGYVSDLMVKMNLGCKVGSAKKVAKKVGEGLDYKINFIYLR
jgi:hypothetical protein